MQSLFIQMPHFKFFFLNSSIKYLTINIQIRHWCQFPNSEVIRRSHSYEDRVLWDWEDPMMSGMGAVSGQRGAQAALSIQGEGDWKTSQVANLSHNPNTNYSYLSQQHCMSSMDHSAFLPPPPTPAPLSQVWSSYNKDWETSSVRGLLKAELSSGCRRGVQQPGTNRSCLGNAPLEHMTPSRVFVRKVMPFGHGLQTYTKCYSLPINKYVSFGEFHNHYETISYHPSVYILP